MLLHRSALRTGSCRRDERTTRRCVARIPLCISELHEGKAFFFRRTSAYVISGLSEVFFMHSRSSKVRTVIRRIVMCAAMTAMSIVLCRFLGISPANSAFRIEIGFLPIAVVGMLYGPVWAGAAYGASDLIGAAVTTGINPFITLCKVLFGVLMGAAFRGKRRGLIYCIAFFIITGIVVDVICMAPIFVHYFGYTAEAAFYTRLVSTVINVPVRIALYYLTDRTMGGRIRKFAPKGSE